MKGLSNILVIFGLLLSIKTAAQTNTTSIKVLGKAYEDSVILRWAPSSPVAWQQLNKYGYKIERFTIVKENKVLDNKPMELLSPLVKPAEQKRWLVAINEDDYVAIAAQAIFGEDFQVSNATSQDVFQVYQKTQELESRYSFVLLAADVSSRAANLSGLRWVDKNVKKDEMYLYRIYSLVPESIIKIEFGFYYTGPADYKPLPIPFAPTVNQISKTTVMVKWDCYTHKDTYGSYYLEKSVDQGHTFSKVTKLPITTLTQANKTADYATKLDSIKSNDNAYYRVVGITSFGEVGPPSESAAALNEPPLKSVPVLTKADVIQNSAVSLLWTFPDTDIKNIKGFYIERSSNVDDKYVILNPREVLNGKTYVDKNPLSTNYYRVIAYTEKGQRAFSFPRMVQLEDSIPPSAPNGLMASIDSMGIVKLTWKQNTEQDLLGYRIFKSSFKNSEFGQVTVSPVIDNDFIDTVNIKTLTRNVWYKIVAVDRRFNTSEFSDVSKLLLPDIIPPVPPVIKRIRAVRGGVELHWVNSSSEDVIEQQVLRKHFSSSTWELVAKFPSRDTNRFYIDKIVAGRKFQYAMIAVDENNLKSRMTKPLWGQALAIAEHGPLKDIALSVDRANKNVQLTWKYKEENVSKFIIYRATDNSSLALYKTIPNPSTGFKDYDVVMNTQYSYRIKALFKDGSESIFSEAFTIGY